MVLSKECADKIEKLCELVFFYYFRTKYDKFWAALNGAESKKNNPETALNRGDHYLQKT